jgi:hypothetical protein
MAAACASESASFFTAGGPFAGFSTGSGSISATVSSAPRPLIASAHASMVRIVSRSPRSMRSSIFPASSPRLTIGATPIPVKRSSSSQAEPTMPPRFIEPIASRLSSAPSNARSSSTSAVPSTPSTPGKASAVTIRSSSSRRFSIARAFDPALKMPRAG